MELNSWLIRLANDTYAASALPSSLLPKAAMELSPAARSPWNSSNQTARITL